jgi:2-polyprenyl-6-methoxyphenol hydroxylase-like FAD-dependent oxidoreductase
MHCLRKSHGSKNAILIEGIRLRTAQIQILRAEFGVGWECAAILDSVGRESLISTGQVRFAGTWSKGRIASLDDAAFAPSWLAGQGDPLAIAAAYVLCGGADTRTGA